MLTVAIKKRSKVPGVMITQFVEEIPPGKSHPDFTRKPIALTIQEGKLAFFKAIVTGDPTPTVRWARNNGDISDAEKYTVVYEKISGEHQLQMPNVTVEQADTYKCLAENEFGRAVVTATLNVIEAHREQPADFKKTLRTRRDHPKEERKDGEVDERFWELLLSADRKDYERICAEYGITDFRWMLKKLNEKKKEIEEQQAQYVEYLSNLKHIEIKNSGCAQFEFEMDLKDPNAKIYLFKDGVMVELNSDTNEKHCLRQVGRKFIFTVNGLSPEDAGLYQVDVEGVNIFSTDFKIPAADFLVKIEEVKAAEREDAVFECLLSAPLQKIKWMGKSAPLVQSPKYEITVSKDMLIHRLVVKDCMMVDKGIYAAVAGIKSCNAWLLVEPDNNPNNHGKKAARKTTQARGSVVDLEKIAAEQQAKLQEQGEWKELLKQQQKRVRTGPLVPDTVIESGVYFTSGLQDVRAIMGQAAEIVCKLSAQCDGVWYKDGKEINPTDDLTIIKEGTIHKLVINNCTEDDSGKYRFEADGRKTEAVFTVEDPPRLNQDDLTKFSEPVVIKVGQNATFKMNFVGRDPMKVQWYNEGEELQNDINIKIEKSPNYSQLFLTKCQRRDTGEIKLKIRNEYGTIEALSKLIVLDKPTNPLGPVEVIEASSSCVEFKWRPPKDDGGSPVIHYNLERQQLGRNTWKKLGNIAAKPHYKDTDVDHGRKYSYRIRAITAEGTSDVFETDDIQAGTKAYPSPPSAPKVVSAFKNCINLSWSPPTNTGGTNIVGYNLEKRKKGSNLWNQVNSPEEPIKAKQYGVKDIVEGIEYEFRVAAINFSGAGEPSSPSEFVIARDPKKSPGKVIDLKVSDSTYSSLSLSWIKPKEEQGVQDEAKGYFVELRPAESTEWTRCNANAIITTSYTILGLKSMAMYWIRVVATNEGGNSEPQDLDNYIIAMPPPVKPNFTDRKMKSFMVVRAGHAARVNMRFEASPMPTITWLKDGMPLCKHVTVSNTEGSSQLLIPSAERSDTGIYTIIIKNIVGQVVFSTEIRVTDDPKPPGPVELEENVPGTLTVSWSPSSDEKRDDHLYYVIAKRDSVKQTWHTVADRVFNNNVTAVNIMPGREYIFRVYAKNDIGLSAPSESTVWKVVIKKEKFTFSLPEHKTISFESAPTFTVPLKTHTSPEKYECYMSCAVKGNPTPHVTWYRNNISLNTNTNYYISNTCGVCSLLILRVGPKDNGEYKVMAENSLGRAECTTKLTIRE
ncbi:immunoglobulin-like and fibronectin type III domain-containing protein 1 [Trichomycterus rosablanca]|uniref:immunoglobulin-like and fibronectin type III domain-containing protein 1 n=1 Tax=Trichomycterus rosablanca TaxID=2290929 RepID=UPI002F360F92